ncbi:MAG: DUF4293 family protein [Bacteroidetes bacterium]|nr:MAG: DUF4293 family protein [Bacteroidota bacterium]TAG88537.1 MAG: DUF4293 family protein [Bacteroidota bacterium]
MIERIQTVFLFLVAVLMVTFMFLPIWEKKDVKTKETVTLSAFSLNYSKEDGGKKMETSITSIYLVIIAGLASALSIFTIFQFKNRILQMKMVLFNTSLMFVLLLLCIFFELQGDKMIKNPQGGSFQFGFFIPAVALLLNLFARRAIKSDEDLVRSSNRMR